MFARTFSECAPDPLRYRKWATLCAFAAQLLLVGIALLHPLIYPERLPIFSAVPRISFSRAKTVQVFGTQEISHRSLAALPNPFSSIALVRHSKPAFSSQFHPSSETAPIPNPGLPGADEIEDRASPQSILSTRGTNVVPAPAVKAPRAVRLSHMDEGKLTHIVQPVYPDLPRRMGVQGEVVLSALIGKDGSIEGLKALSGPPLLVPAALQAVSQWKYKPYILNGAAVEVQTTIHVNFRLGDR
ncbi:MAG TPA: energy transducer TonB [Terriglobales bacterium]